MLPRQPPIREGKEKLFFFFLRSRLAVIFQCLSTRPHSRPRGDNVCSDTSEHQQTYCILGCTIYVRNSVHSADLYSLDRPRLLFIEASTLLSFLPSPTDMSLLRAHSLLYHTHTLTHIHFFLSFLFHTCVIAKLIPHIFHYSFYF